jgi:hypothetical protein
MELKYKRGDVCILRANGKNNDVAVVGSVSHMGNELTTVAPILQFKGDGKVIIGRKSTLIKGFDHKYLTLKPLPKQPDPVENNEMVLKASKGENTNGENEVSKVKAAKTRRKAVAKPVQSDEHAGATAPDSETNTE